MKFAAFEAAAARWALAPVRAMDSRAFQTVEPAVTFDAGARHGEH